MTERVVVIGGGIAGIAAALRLGENGVPVTLYERRPLLGGRASSLPLSEADGEGIGTDALVDNCQHVLMRCCTNLLDFYSRIGAADQVEFFDRFSFVDRQNRWSSLSSSPLLPAPLHLLPSLLKFRSMSPLDKAAILYAMARLTFLSADELADHDQTFGDWLSRMHQTSGAIESFWRPVVVSALNEEPDRTAAAYAFQLFRKAFLGSRHSFEMGLPRTELAEIYSGLGAAALTRLGVQIRMKENVMGVEVGDSGVEGFRLDQELLAAATVVMAVPHQSVSALLPGPVSRLSPFKELALLEHSPITGIHLWFDRPVANRRHTALLHREMQWIFTKEETASGSNGPAAGTATPRGSYLGLVVSASRQLTSRTRAEILDLAIEAVHSVYPASRDARLVREMVIREPKATFSPSPGAEMLRPHARTPIRGLYLAGDWTRTGWPATMEGAVRGGYLAAQALLKDRGCPVDLIAPDLPPDRLPALLGL